ncbi:synaptonemal complex protein 1 isoform X2 [Oreochromis aureus]|uniref:Synaptonemal complex protein 1 n=1 Tax=Oreochromis aureus TaxID=47969 RepID=A0AAZ1X885_OREAU|nr:synaptonemal complex protein 1 isoform X2 [Oreochromis aureus]
MERDQRFSFKLLVPPRVNNGPISAVQPREIVEDRGDFMKALQPSYSECFDKEKNILFPNTNVVAPTKPPKQDFLKMKLMQPMEKDENNSNPGQLYSKLFDEVEKIKCWKVKVYSDTVEKERRLQDNKRTIETQRKAIQELQFGNESLSIKLEEQISENEELRNKNNSTWNLCNILKETFDSSVEKIHLFEAEREETHDLLTENNESVKKLIAAFESLRVRVETDQQEMEKVKEDLLQFDHLQKKYQQEFQIKQEEITMFQIKLKDKETELQKLLLDFDETQKHCNELQQSTNHQFELLKSAKAEQESLLQQLDIAEQRCRETEKNQETTAAALEQSKKEYAEIIQNKDLSLQELNKVKNQQAEELECIQSTIQELKTSLALEIQRAKELEDKLIKNNTELERRNTVLGETIDQATKKDGLIQILKDELKEADNAFAENDSLKKACEAAEKEKEHLKEKSTLTQIKVQELEEQLCTEMKKNKECNFQMEQMRKDILQNEVKYEELLSNFNELQSEKTAIQEQFENGFSNVKAIEANMKVSEEKALKLKGEIQTLEEKNKTLRDELTTVKTQILGKCVQTETLQKQIKEKYEQLQVKITEKEKQIKAVETKLCKLTKKYEIKFKAQEEYKKENKMLKKQMAQEIAKSNDLETTINSLQNESQYLKQLKGEEHEKLLKDLESKSTFAAELEKEVQKLRITAAEAIKNKEATELKCQHKIGDMVTLMEKHKSQYDRMVQEKDAELEEKKKNEMEATARAKSLELDLSKHKTENERLKKELKAETKEKENLRNKISDLKQEMSVVKSTLLSQGSDKQAAAINYKQGNSSELPKENSSKSHTFDFFKAKKTSSYSKDGQSLAARMIDESASESIRASCGTPKSKCINSEDMKTPRSLTNHTAGTTKIKSYRIRTPPSEKSAQWGKSAIELDPKSDSSDQNDLLTFTNVPERKSSDSQCKLHILKKNQSPLVHKSPGNSLKVAAMKRMRDAGWTAVTGCDKKKKKTNEKIFA